MSLKTLEITDSFAGELIKGENCFSDMKGAVLNISVVVLGFQQYDTYAVVEPSGEVKLYPCIAYEFLAVVQIGMNFTPKFTPTDHWGFYDIEKSEWKGMVGHLVRNITDLALAGSVETPQRHAVVDFNLNYDEWQFVALYRTPDLNNGKFALLRPFSPLVWLAIGGFCVSVFLTLFFVSTVHRRHILPNANGATSSPENQNLRHYDCIFWAGQILSSKSIYLVPPTGSIRIVVLVGYFAAVVLNLAYSGTLISFLKVASNGFTRFDELLETTFIFDSRPDPTFQMLKESSSPSVVEAVLRIRQKPVYKEVAHAKEKLLGGSFVFMAHDFAAYDALNNNFNERDRCLFSYLMIPMRNPKSGTMVPKKSPIKRIIDYQIIKAKQFGLNQCWLRRYVPKKPVCSIMAEVGIPLDTVLVAICILILGAVTSFVALVSEIIYNFLGQQEDFNRQTSNHGGIFSNPWSLVAL